MRTPQSLVLASIFSLALFGCSNNANREFGEVDAGIKTDASFPDGEMPEAGSPDGFNLDVGGEGGCAPPCPTGTFCMGGKCVAEQPPCGTDDQCQNDSYCDVPSGKCLPYGPPGKTHNPDCKAVGAVGLFVPAERCHYSATDPGDPFPAFLNVLATPAVATFEKGGKPSIVAPFWDGTDDKSEQDGILRVLSGTDCKQLAQLGKIEGETESTMVSASSSVAIADLDGDGVPEIVAYSKPTKTTASLIAFKKKGDGWTVLWRATDETGKPFSIPSGSQAAGPSIHDVDDDGSPEIFREGYVFDAKGKLLAKPPSGFTGINYKVGQFPVVADIDGDGKLELANGIAIYRFNPSSKSWDIVADKIPLQDANTAALTALADFGTDAIDGVLDGKAEIVAVYGGRVYIEAANGKIIYGPIKLPGTLAGGPPTIADLDGDGYPEIAIAGDNSLTVVDPDCSPKPLRAGGKCKTGRIEGWLWSKVSQDVSGFTGASVFDFDGDGAAEVIYSDECFTRVYKGDTGEVIFSQYTSSCTWYENPIVADTNLDDRADLIIPANLNCGTSNKGVVCGDLILDKPDKDRPSLGVDYVFAGLRCKDKSDCASGVCDGGLCRCLTDAECCSAKDADKCLESGYACVPPPAGTSGAKTCRATHPHGRQGIYVYRDVADRWVKARPMWNQHAYSITNVSDDGTVPQTSKWTPNWKTPKLNDFRRNAPGEGEVSLAPDLTVKASSSFCSGGKLTLSVQVCNRGALKAADNYTVSFYEGDKADASKTICTAVTSKPLGIAECETLSCEWKTPPKVEAKNVFVVVDPDARVRQCNKNNKSSFIKDVKCAGPA